jgi:hypothetical protein
MVFQIEHFGLYFARKQAEAAAKEREKHAVLQNAWQWLLAKEGDVIFERKLKDRETEQVVKGKLSPLGQAVEAGFRYRFMGDEAEAEKGTAFLEQISLETIHEQVAAAHLAELLRPFVSQEWRDNYAEISANALEKYAEAEALDKFWLIALSIVSGLVLEDENRTERGAELFRKVIDEEIHPEGYFRSVVEGAKEALPVFQKMLLSLGALSLAAEAGEQIGLKLWKYEKRDVGLNTAASYLVYYYFYPDKWRWGTGLSEADTQAAFQEHGAFMEILTSHVNPRGVELLLDEQRPFFSPILGGLTSLSHFKTEKRKRGFFG